MGADDARQPKLADGTSLNVANVVWCTGFRPDYSWIHLPILNEHGWPDQERGVVAATPGLYVLGMPFLHGFSSMLVLGAGRDAAHVVDRVAARADPAGRPARWSDAAAPGMAGTSVPFAATGSIADWARADRVQQAGGCGSGGSQLSSPAATGSSAATRLAEIGGREQQDERHDRQDRARRARAPGHGPGGAGQGGCVATVAAWAAGCAAVSVHAGTVMLASATA